MKFLKIKTTDKYDTKPQIININSFEELCEIAKLNPGNGIVIRENLKYTDMSVNFILEIYDGYRE